MCLQRHSETSKGKVEVSVCLCEHTTRKIMLKEWIPCEIQKSKNFMIPYGERKKRHLAYISRRVENNRLRQTMGASFLVVGQSLHKICKTHRN